MNQKFAGLRIDNKNIIFERDRYRIDLYEVTKARDIIEKEKKKFAKIMNERVDNLEKQIAIRNVEISN